MSLSIVQWNQGYVSYPDNKNLRDMSLEFSLGVSMPVVNEGIDISYVTLTCVPEGTSDTPVDVKIPFSLSSISAGMSGIVFSWTCDLHSLLGQHSEYSFLSQDPVGTFQKNISITPTITLDGEDGSGGSLNFTSSAGSTLFTSCYSIYRPLFLSRRNARIRGSNSAYKVDR